MHAHNHAQNSTVSWIKPVLTNINHTATRRDGKSPLFTPSTLYVTYSSHDELILRLLPFTSFNIVIKNTKQNFVMQMILVTVAYLHKTNQNFTICICLLLNFRQPHVLSTLFHGFYIILYTTDTPLFFYIINYAVCCCHPF